MKFSILLGFLFFLVAEAQFRAGTLSWKNIGGSNIEFTVYTVWTVQSSATLYFGDGQYNSANLTKETIIGGGQDSEGVSYVIQQRIVSHYYSSSGPFTAYLEGTTLRPSTLIVGASTPFNIQTLVTIGSEISSPTASFLPITQFKIGENNQQPISVVTPVGYSSDCYLSIPSISNLPVANIGNSVNGNPVSVSSNCVINWNTTGGSNYNFYAVQITIQNKETGTYINAAFEIELVNGPKPSMTNFIGFQDIKACSSNSLNIVAYSQLDQTLISSSEEVIPGSTFVPPLGKVNSSSGYFTTTFNYNPSNSDVGEVSNGYFVYTDSSLLTAWTPLAVRVNNLVCSDILSYTEQCVNNKTKYINLTSSGDISHSWSMNCPGALLSDTSASNTILSVNATQFTSCSVSVVAVDSCFGTLNCSVSFGSSCCSTVVDLCGVCGGNDSTCLDCNGIPNGGKVVDDCGVCGGDGSTCCSNYLGLNNDLWDYLLVPDAVNSFISRLESTYSVIEWTWNNLPEQDNLPSRVDCEDIGDIAEINRMFLSRLEQFCFDSGSFLTSLEYSTNNFII